MHRPLIRVSGFAIAVSALVVISLGGEPPKADSAANVQIAAQAFISLLQREKFAEAEKRFDATMQQALPAANLQSLWQDTVKANGAFQKCEPGTVNHVNKLDVVDTPCDFEKSTVVIRISFDKRQKIAGLFLIPAESRSASDKNASDIQCETSTGTLFGTLDLPAGKGPWPAVLVIAGSGPTDRDGNQPFMKNDSLRLVGKALAAHGVAALRYDKRGIGKSAAAGAVEVNLRLENYVEDAVSWLKQLRGDSRFNKVVILGHSEGSLAGMLAAKREPVDRLISVAGAGRDLATILRDQLKRNLPQNLFVESSHIIDELAAGRKVDNVPPVLNTLFRPIVQPFLMSSMKYNPGKEIADVTVPILVVQGSTDLQISMDDASLLAANNKNARLVAIENMNHVLKNAPSQSLAEQAAAYSDPSLPLAPKLMDEILSFVQKH
jgi:uncharacterized protein